MLILLIFVLAVTSVCFLMLKISEGFEDNDKNLKTLKFKIAVPFSVSVALWLVWFGIREYWPPINIPEHWLSVLIALISMIFAIAAAIRAFSSPISLRLAMGFFCLFLSFICLLGLVLSIPVS